MYVAFTDRKRERRGEGVRVCKYSEERGEEEQEVGIIIDGIIRLCLT